MEIAEKIKKAKIQLILDQPFFASFALRLQYVADARIDTAVTDGITMRYNPGFMQQLPVKQIAGVIAHEVLHLTSLHHTRRGSRDIKLWNMAADYAINPLLIDAKMELPKVCLLDPRFNGMNAERIYSFLEQEPDTDSASDTGQRIGDIEDLPASENVKETEAQIKQDMVEAAMIARRQGNLPDFIERLVSEALQPRISWQEVLQRCFTEVINDDYAWVKPASRYLHLGLYLPSVHSTQLGCTILIVDTSGSIDGDLINRFAAEVQEITSVFNIPLSVMYVDTTVQFIQEIEPDDQIRLTPKGGGGTDFKPGFDFIEEHGLDPEVVIYMTDGACFSFPSSPSYDVLWAKFGDYPFDPPFGEVVEVIEL